jgi:UDP-2,4-diacetamido-2,4,6-trideoxy-beta-L-altropyranose hydrolase
MDKRLIVRADASTRIGIGHVMRCLALAQAWQDAGGHVVFVMCVEAPALKARLTSQGMEVIHLSARPATRNDAVQTVGLAQHMGASWVVVDGYHFGTEYQRIIKDAGLRLLFIDDTGHANRYCADVVLNQNAHAHEGMYTNREAYTRLLLGARYILLRREFLGYRDWKPEIPGKAERILVTMGGADPDNATLKVIQALNLIGDPHLQARIVVGPSNSNIESLQNDSLSGFSFEILTSAKDMPGLMAWADVAVSAGGSTCWELAFMGLPSMVVVLAENQRDIAMRAQAVGMALNLGWHEHLLTEHLSEVLTGLIQSPAQRRRMSQSGKALVDGNGAVRVAERLRRQLNMGGV